MARYIDADKFLKSMISRFKCVPLIGIIKYIKGEECFECEDLDTLINETFTADVEEKRECEKCVHFLKDVTQYPCSHCRNCYTDKFQPNDIHQEEGEDK